MTEKRLNNTIFLMHTACMSYRRMKNISKDEFLELDEKYQIINYIAECPDIFDSMTEEEMAEEIERYVSQ